jgi:hypothetical protein
MTHLHHPVADKRSPGIRGALCCDAMPKGDKLADHARDVTCPICKKVAPLVAMLRRYRTELGWVADHKPLHDAADALLALYEPDQTTPIPCDANAKPSKARP